MKQRVIQAGAVMIALLFVFMAAAKYIMQMKQEKTPKVYEREAASGTVFLHIECTVPKVLWEEIERRAGGVRGRLSGVELELWEEQGICKVVLKRKLEAVKQNDWKSGIREILLFLRELTQFRPREAVILPEKAEGKSLGEQERDKRVDEKMATREATGKYRLKVTESRIGFAVDIEKSMLATEEMLAQLSIRMQKNSAEYAALTIPVATAEVKPKLTTEQAKRCNTLISEYSTAFETAGTGRARNISVGAAHLNGKVILPGEEFSTAAALMPFSAENGYAEGGTYMNGEVTESIGGGVCQLSSTLYNALLQTGLTVTKRAAHSMPVAYVPLGLDAAIAGDYKDLCFCNISDVPVLLLCEVAGRTVTVYLYGGAEAKLSEVMFETVTVKETEEEIWVETYRSYPDPAGKQVREKIGESRYRYPR